MKTPVSKRSDLFDANLGIPEKIARKYRNCGVASYLELLTVAQESLWQSCLDMAKASRSFASFARYNAKGVVIRYIHWCSYGTRAKFGGEYVSHYPTESPGDDDENNDDEIENNHRAVLPELASEGPSPFDIVSSLERLRFAIAAIDELPKRKREVFVASLSGEGFDKLAPKLGMTRKGMSSMTSKARAEVVAKSSRYD